MSTEHIAPRKMYFAVFFALLCLTAATTGVAYIDLGAWNTVVALAIAFCKASLVVLFFMHLKWGTGTMKTVAVVAIAWLTLLIVLTNADNYTRGWLGTPEQFGPTALARPAATATQPPAAKKP